MTPQCGILTPILHGTACILVVGLSCSKSCITATKLYHFLSHQQKKWCCLGYLRCAQANSLVSIEFVHWSIQCGFRLCSPPPKRFDDGEGQVSLQTIKWARHIVWGQRPCEASKPASIVNQSNGYCLVSPRRTCGCPQLSSSTVTGRSNQTDTIQSTMPWHSLHQTNVPYDQPLSLSWD